MEEQNKVVSVERIIEEILTIRNSKIELVLQPDEMVTFAGEHFDVVALSAVKMEFLTRDLLMLRESSLDLPHYSGLIRHMKESTADYHGPDLFVAELKTVFAKYIAPK